MNTKLPKEFLALVNKFDPKAPVKERRKLLDKMGYYMVLYGGKSEIDKCKRHDWLVKGFVFKFEDFELRVDTFSVLFKFKKLTRTCTIYKRPYYSWILPYLTKFKESKTMLALAICYRDKYNQLIGKSK